MKILVSNDDGFFAPGIDALKEAAKLFGEVTTIAPDRNRSGASNSLTLSRPLRIKKIAANNYSVEGTPTDCVHLALGGALDLETDLVLSGINAGANLGDDVLYSGTVAAAMEGRNLGFPAVAFSLVETQHDPNYYTATEVVKLILTQLCNSPLSSNILLNVNIPDCTYSELKGIKITRLGTRHRSESVTRHHDPRGREFFWLGKAGPSHDASEGTDFHAVAEGYVSVTPIHMDLTHHASMETVTDWAASLSVGESD